MKKFTFTRCAIVQEVFEIMAEDEWAAGEQLKWGPAPVSSEFVDWFNDEYTLDNVEEIS
jgi:hypothetical protein